MTENKSCWHIFNDEEIALHGAHQYLSFADLQLIPEFRLALMREDKEEFERILFENGLDISQGYNIINCTHRMRTSNRVYSGFKVQSLERLDQEWISSGAASEHAVMMSYNKDLRDELRALDPHNANIDWEEERECTVNLEYYD